MSFHSWTFVFFFVVVYGLYLSFRCKWQNRILLFASYFFYGWWDWRFLSLILISTCTDYLCAQWIATSSKSTRKWFLVISLCVNLGLLAFFKYFLFLCENVIGLFALFGITIPQPEWNILLPVGISFYTFQTLSYTIDVYRKQIPCIDDFVDYALFVSFFPQLLAGPIERASHLIPQIQQPRILQPKSLTEGLFLIYWGVFKKLFIADNLGTLLAVYCSSNSTGGGLIDGGLVLISGYLFLFQLYCDFSAYSDIARGLAKLMGIEIMENFRSPLFASNIQDTWARWHISLTTWVRDYVYFPLALQRIWNTHINDKLLILFVFLLIGIWHGAAWNFVIWGLYHGLLLAGYAFIKPKINILYKNNHTYINVFLTFLSTIITFHCVVIGALLFRAETLNQIVVWIQQIVFAFTVTSFHWQLIAALFFYSFTLLLFDGYDYFSRKNDWFFRTHWLVRYGFLYLTLYLLVIYGTKKPATFIYFQF
jgi:alginate O-acetyltransferase complex protein AlgI